jgi:hypothetical protein
MLYQIDRILKESSDLKWDFYQFPFIAIIYKRSYKMKI